MERGPDLLLVFALLIAASGAASAPLAAIAYYPYSRSLSLCRDPSGVASDVALLARLTRKLRLYSCACADSVLQAVQSQNAGLKVMLGVAITINGNTNEQEMSTLLFLLSKYGNTKLIDSVSVGNEALGAGVQLDGLLLYLNRARALLKPYGIPVTYADTPATWFGQAPPPAAPPAPPPSPNLLRPAPSIPTVAYRLDQPPAPSVSSSQTPRSPPSTSSPAAAAAGALQPSAPNAIKPEQASPSPPAWPPSRASAVPGVSRSSQQSASTPSPQLNQTVLEQASLNGTATNHSVQQLNDTAPSQRTVGNDTALYKPAVGSGRRLHLLQAGSHQHHTQAAAPAIAGSQGHAALHATHPCKLVQLSHTTKSPADINHDQGHDGSPLQGSNAGPAADQAQGTASKGLSVMQGSATQGSKEQPERQLQQQPSRVPLTSVPSGVSAVLVPPSVQQLVNAVDFVEVNVQPYLSGIPVTCSGLNLTYCYDAATWTLSQVASVQQFLNKRVVLSATGWPTAGEPCCDQPPLGFPSTAQYLAVPSPEANAQYMTRLVNAATATGVQYVWYQAMDADWRHVHAPCRCAAMDGLLGPNCTGECSYDYNWGLLDKNRQLKAGVNLTGWLRTDVVAWSPPPPSPPPPAPSPPPRPPPPSPSAASGRGLPNMAVSLLLAALAAAATHTLS